MNTMTATFPGKFNKGPYCPSSQSLLAYHKAELSEYRSEQVEGHLTACDFCNAELQLLTRHQNNLEESTFAEMPAQLRQLAEHLLRQGSRPW